MNGKGTTQYKKVRREGGSVVIAMGNHIPSDWKMVRLVTVGKPTDRAVTVKFEKVA